MPHITVQGHKFEVPDAVIARFQPGYVIASEGEAHALRQTCLENLRNNFAGKVKTTLNGAETLTDEQQNSLQADFEKYAGEYEFGVRSAGGGGGAPRRDPVEREMYKLAKDDIKKAYYAKHGQQIDKDVLDEKADQLIELKHDDYAKRARAILRQRENAGSESLAESLGL